MKHYLYTLVFDAEPEPVVFYVGHTNDPDRRRREHIQAVKNHENTEYKYQWCRSLAEVGLSWDLVVIDEIADDEDSEYAWVLKFARHNQSLGIKFIDDLPLTNMRAGDFLTEILAIPEIKTADDIREYRNAKSIRAISYERDGGGTGEYTEQGVKHIEEAHRIALQLSLEETNKKLNKTKRTSTQMTEEEVRKQNSLLLKRELLEKSLTWDEYNAEMQRIGYPEWTETKPQFKY